MNLKKILSLFPPPEFLNIPYSGLSISDTAIRCLHFSRKDNNLSVSQYVEKKLSPGMVESGLINKTEEVSAILKEIKKEMNLGYVKVSLPEEKAYLFTTKIPIVKSEEIRSAVESKFEENVPVSASELVFDYFVLNPDEGSDHLHVVVSALPLSVIDQYMKIFDDVGVKILSLEVESQAIVKAVLNEKDVNSTLIVHFDKDRIGLYVSNRGVVHFTSTISTKNLEFDFKEYVLSEIDKLYAYWHSLKVNSGQKNKKISQIVICGEEINEELVSFLEENTKTDTRLGNVWANVLDIEENLPQMSFPDSLKYAPAIGLALPTKNLL